MLSLPSGKFGNIKTGSIPIISTKISKQKQVHRKENTGGKEMTLRKYRNWLAVLAAVLFLPALPVQAANKDYRIDITDGCNKSSVSPTGTPPR